MTAMVLVHPRLAERHDVLMKMLAQFGLDLRCNRRGLYLEKKHARPAEIIIAFPLRVAPQLGGPDDTPPFSPAAA